MSRMLRKAIQDLQDAITNNNLKPYQAKVLADVKADDYYRLVITFESKSFKKVKILGLMYKDAPDRLKRYYDDEITLIHVPTEKAIECLSDMIDEAWVRIVA